MQISEQIASHANMSKYTKAIVKTNTFGWTHVCTTSSFRKKINNTQGHKPRHISELAQSVFAQPKDDPQIGDVVPDRSQNISKVFPGGAKSIQDWPKIVQTILNIAPEP